jgi:hypothetical protein
VYVSIESNLQRDTYGQTDRALLGLDPKTGNGTVLPAPQLIERLRVDPNANWIIGKNPFRNALLVQDSLLLTTEQLDTLTKLASEFDAVRDTLYVQWGTELATLRNDSNLLMNMRVIMRGWQRKAVAQYTAAGHRLKEILTPEQWELDFPDTFLKALVEGRGTIDL